MTALLVHAWNLAPADPTVVAVVVVAFVALAVAYLIRLVAGGRKQDADLPAARARESRARRERP